LPPPDDPDAFLIDEHHHLDLTEAVRQALVVEQPMAPLCRPDCAGLCPECGADLNAGPHSCAAEPEDSRWAALRALATDAEDRGLDAPSHAGARNARHGPNNSHGHTSATE
jgi:uncharacterized metal-binding protein YceD (DUF177 family)